MAKKKEDENWATIVTSEVIFGIPITVLLARLVKNPTSVIIAMLGVFAAIILGYLLYKLKKEQQPNMKKIKYVVIALSVSAVVAIAGMCTANLNLSFIENINKETVIKNIDLKGVDENSTPLAVSDLKLLKKGTDYTIICNLKKSSNEPTEGFFDFKIAFVDKNGKYITEENINSIDDDLPAFRNGQSYHFEKEFYISKNENKPVTIDITDIKEYDKTTFIKTALNKALENIRNKQPESAKKYINKVLEYDSDNAEAKLLLEHISDPNYSPAPSSDETEKNVLIGTNKDNVRRLLSQYKEKKSLMGENAIDFDSNDLLVTVFFKDDVADGVAFLSNNLDDMNTITGEGSYVSKHYDELVAMASDDPNIKVESDLTKFNSQGNKKYAAELYIGNTPYDNQGSSEASASTTAPIPAQSSESQKAPEKSEFSQCLSSGIVIGVKLYAKPSNDSYIGTITSISDDVLDERGKKTKAVYISGGKADGWYKRWDVGDLYVRNDDPNLPSGRYFAESMGVD